MTNQKHTPGPWAVEVEKNNGGTWGYSIRELNPSCHGTIGKHIATINRYLDAESNAALIAAAPELLVALKAVMNNNSYWWQEVGEDVVRLVKSAIKKAEGR